MDPLRRAITNDDMIPLLEVMQKFRVMDAEMPAQLLATFLYIASHDGCHTGALQEDLELTAASSSRNTDWLSNRHRTNPARGLNLITKEVDPSNRRRHVLKLTAQGRLLVKELSTILNG